MRVRGDPVDDGVGEDLLLHPVVPLTGWQLGAVDRRRGLVSPIDQRVQLLDLCSARCREEPVVDDEKLDFDQGVQVPLLVTGAFASALAT